MIVVLVLRFGRKSGKCKQLQGFRGRRVITVQYIRSFTNALSFRK